MSRCGGKTGKANVLLALAVVAASLYQLACSGGTTAAAVRPDVVIVVMDTTRRDHLSCYGYPRATSPTLTTLVEDSRVYTRAYSTSSWTPPAHASLFTGLYPIAHGCTQLNWDLDENLDTLAEILQRSGYHTIGLVGNPMLGKGSNFEQGFDEYHEMWKLPNGLDVRAEHALVKELRNSLERLDPTQSVFSFINFIEPHSPYDSSRQFMRSFLSGPSIGPTSNDWRSSYLGAIDYDEAAFLHLGELYDAELRYVDYLIGQVIETLKSSGRWENTVFIVTSDHGENLGDHGHVDHVFNLYETTIKIPLIIHYPPLFPPGSRDDRLAQLTDIFPTVLNILGVSGQSGDVQGHDLISKSSAERQAVFCEYYYPEQALRLFGQYRADPRLDPYRRHIKAVIHGNLKLIWGSDGVHELYDLEQDPDEHANRLESEQYEDEVASLITMVNALTQSYHIEGRGVELLEEAEPPTDPETIDALRKLGYID